MAGAEPQQLHPGVARGPHHADLHVITIPCSAWLCRVQGRHWATDDRAAACGPARRPDAGAAVRSTAPIARGPGTSGVASWSERRPPALRGVGSQRLGRAVAAYLGMPLGRSETLRFSEGNLFVRVLENVRGRDTYIIQGTAFPANDNFMELLFWIDALEAGQRRLGHGGDPLLQLRQRRQEGRAPGVDPGPGVRRRYRGRRRRTES